MFRDEALIEAAAGNGGDGMVSFHREKYVQKGGPDGGDGGRGGDIVLVASESVHSLLRVARAHRYVAKNGRPGGTNQRSGRSADHVRIEVPPGTQVFDAEHGNMLFDLDQKASEVVIARGGKGGLGNQHFATSTSQVPTKAYPGSPGEQRSLRLELKVIA